MKGIPGHTQNEIIILYTLLLFIYIISWPNSSILTVLFNCLFIIRYIIYNLVYYYSFLICVVIYI